MICSVTANIIILVCCLIGLLYGIYNSWKLRQVKISDDKGNYYKDFSKQDYSVDQRISLMLEVSGHIERGARSFLKAEYKVIFIFCLVMSVVIIFAVETRLGEFWTTVAFLLGAITSLISGYVGMRVAVFSNYRCACKAQTSLSDAFSIAYRAGCVMGFTLCSLGVLVLLILIAIYNNWFLSRFEDIDEMYEKIAGYGLGGSTMALFGRVGGGIYTKAADVGSDLVGKVEANLPEDSPSNPGTVADNVGDNVGDVAGMGADLFGSFAEATCAALVVCSTSPSFFFHPSSMYYPIMISALSIIACLITSIFAINAKCKTYNDVQGALKGQLIISTILLIPALWIAGYITLPHRIVNLSHTERSHWAAFICCVFGLVSGLAIGLYTEYYTSHSHTPVQEVAESCRTGAATNIIYGLALGNFSTVVPVICLAITCYVSHFFLGMFGVALAALGMLSNLSVGLAIDSYGPVSDNAGGIAEMCELNPVTRERTDMLDAAGNTTAAIGKGFAIGSAALVSLALYGAYLTRSSKPTNNHPIVSINVIEPLIFSGVLIGAMLPYAFSAMCMKAVGKAAEQMVIEIRQQLRKNPKIITGEARPDFERCIEISTQYSLKEMIAPGALVLFTPFFIGIFIGPQAIAGLLPGAMVSAVAQATAQANSGGAWDNAKKFIEGKHMKDLVTGETIGKGSNEHKAAVIGDTVGDPLKDTSGPSLNILMKLMAIFSLVFYKFFDNTALLQCFLAPRSPGCS